MSAGQHEPERHAAAELRCHIATDLDRDSLRRLDLNEARATADERTVWSSLRVAIAEARNRRAHQHAAATFVERVDLFHQHGRHRFADDRFDLRDTQPTHRGERYRAAHLTASRNQDKILFDPDMAPKRERQFRHAGWSVRGELRIAGDPSDATDAVTSLATRFVLEAHGRWKAAVARPANAIGISMEAGGLESEFHTHVESQLLFQVRGELTCEASNALWIVPPQSALWVPGGVSHRIRGRAPLEGYSVFVERRAGANLPQECCAVSVSALFRELLFRLATRPAQYDLEGPDARLVGVLLDELAAARVENHRLPMPTEPRLRRLVEAIVANPADASTADMWARRVGIGERTLNRLLVKETGLSFGRWRQQLHITLAIQRMARGASVQQVATDLGYGSASSFVTMFRKALGASPARYMAHRLDGG